MFSRKRTSQADSQNSHSRIILAQKISAWNMPALIIASRIGFDVYYMFYPDFMNKPGATTKDVTRRLEKLGLKKFSFATGCGSDPYGYEKHAPAHARAVFKQAFGSVEFSELSDMFKGLEASVKKLPVLFFNHICDEAMEIADLISVARALAKQDRRVYIFHPSSAIQTRIFTTEISGFTNIYPWVVSSGFTVVRMASKLIGRQVKKIFSLVRRDRTAPKPNVAPPASDEPAQVVYFPHRGMIYHNLFYKDHYYDDDPKSAFHVKRILHVELHEELREDSKQYYDKAGINYKFMSMGLPLNVANVVLLFQVLGKLWSATTNSKKLRERIFATAIMIRGYVKFLRGWVNTSSLEGAKVALIGYDILFPTPLVLALQARDIKVVAMQERLIHVFHNSIHPIFDAYFISGKRVRERLLENEFQWLKEMPVIGLPRAELIKKYQAESSSLPLEKNKSPDQLVVVLDFSPSMDPFGDRDNSIICREACKAFYQDIIDIAQSLPKAHFVIRGKNDNWCAMPYFSDIVNLIQQSPNIEVSHKYDVVNVSYQLVAAADLVIGRQTSLGDEAMAMGIPVLFHDWTPTRSRNVADIYDYDGFPVYTHSFEELKTRTRKVLLEGDYMEEDDFAKLRESLFSVSSSNPKREMLNYLLSILN